MKPQVCLDDDKMLQDPEAVKHISPGEDDGIARFAKDNNAKVSSARNVEPMRARGSS
jgi:hypothetical protein